MRVINGYAASPGLGLGPAYIVSEPDLTIPARSITDPAAELARLGQAVAVARKQLSATMEQALASVGKRDSSIFEAQALILQDPALARVVSEEIEHNRTSVEAAWSSAIEGFARQMDALKDETLRARAADVRDVGRRVLLLLLGREELDLSKIDTPSVIVARDLTPSQTVRLKPECALAFVTSEGGPTSHTAILAKAMGIPAVVAAGAGLSSILQGEKVLVDGGSGEVIVGPDDGTLAAFSRRASASSDQARQDLTEAQASATTLDGHTVEMAANIGGKEEASAALRQGAEAIGLLRTEFLYLDRSEAPSEQEQFDQYRAILDAMGPRPVVIRTLDIGGDKGLAYLGLEAEANPFLGYRAIRVSLDQPGLFKTQLRAILRAGTGHPLRIMFPMIATLAELRSAKMILEEARSEVLAAGDTVPEDLQVGMMVEIPSVVQMAELFAREVDFFSIGTNDMTQYTMAAERTNRRVAHLGDACHPAVLRQIRSVIEAGHRAGIWVGVCGELAGEPDAIPILLGLGLDEFSMAPASLPRAKAIVRRWRWDDARSLAANALGLESAEAVHELMAGKADAEASL